MNSWCFLSLILVLDKTILETLLQKWGSLISWSELSIISSKKCKVLITVLSIVVFVNTGLNLLFGQLAVSSELNQSLSIGPMIKLSNYFHRSQSKTSSIRYGLNSKSCQHLSSISNTSYKLIRSTKTMLFKLMINN